MSGDREDVTAVTSDSGRTNEYCMIVRKRGRGHGGIGKRRKVSRTTMESLFPDEGLDV